ncbi:MAG: hypothetical protein SOW25_04730 [Helicobacter sp.]|nr:hypothetical protein [Helicobacteraceae bacterium]MDY3113617.1 hypothetical protein [Helicobacter sp.]
MAKSGKDSPQLQMLQSAIFHKPSARRYGKNICDDFKLLLKELT